MSKPFKCFISYFFMLACLLTGHAQNNHWLVGEWKGIGIVPGSAYSTVFVRTLVIKKEYRNQLTGTLIQEITDNRGTRIEKKFSGNFANNEIKLATGRTLSVKQPPKGFWADCSACTMNSSWFILTSDSILLNYETRLCGAPCDGLTTYARALSDFDTLTQKKIVRLFGSTAFEKKFKPIAPADAGHKQDLPVAAAMNADHDTMQSQLNRKNKVIATYNVADPDIHIELFDNGEIDGDMVTVYHNKERVIDRQVLGTAPILFSVKASTQDRVHEFILVANNLGRIPPNTALLRIKAGPKTYEVFASTTLNNNASVIIVYSGH